MQNLRSGNKSVVYGALTNDQLRAYKEHLTDEMERIAVLYEQGRQSIREVFSGTPVVIDNLTQPD